MTTSNENLPRVWTLNDAERTRMLYPCAGPRPGYGEVVPVVEAQPLIPLLEQWLREAVDESGVCEPVVQRLVDDTRALLATLKDHR